MMQRTLSGLKYVGGPILFVLLIIFVVVETGNYQRKQAEKIVTGYSDLGKGIVVIDLNKAQLDAAFTQWKQDYPQKAKAIMAAAFDRNEFVVLYKIVPYKTE